MEKVKAKVSTTLKDTKQVVKGAEDLVLATALVITSGYNAYDLTIREVGQVESYVRAAASAIIATVGAYAVVKVFKAIGEKK